MPLYYCGWCADIIYCNIIVQCWTITLVRRPIYSTSLSIPSSYTDPGEGGGTGQLVHERTCDVLRLAGTNETEPVTWRCRLAPVDGASPEDLLQKERVKIVRYRCQTSKRSSTGWAATNTTRSWLMNWNKMAAPCSNGGTNDTQARKPACRNKVKILRFCSHSPSP